jgi:myosin heavy subunit
MRDGGESWMQFRALNPQGGGGFNSNDGREFVKTIQAMSFLGIARQQQLDIFKTVLAVLLLSNIMFTQGKISGGEEGALVVDSTSVAAAELLGCSQPALHQALTQREIKVSARETYSVHTPLLLVLLLIFAIKLRKGTTKHRSSRTNA